MTSTRSCFSDKQWHVDGFGNKETTQGSQYLSSEHRNQHILIERNATTYLRAAELQEEEQEHGGDAQERHVQQGIVNAEALASALRGQDWGGSGGERRKGGRRLSSGAADRGHGHARGSGGRRRPPGRRQQQRGRGHKRRVHDEGVWEVQRHEVRVKGKGKRRGWKELGLWGMMTVGVGAVRAAGGRNGVDK